MDVHLALNVHRIHHTVRIVVQILQFVKNHRTIHNVPQLMQPNHITVAPLQNALNVQVQLTVQVQLHHIVLQV